MKKHLFLSLLMIWSGSLLAGTVTNVRVNPDIDLVVTGTTNKSFTLGSAEASGDSTSETAPSRLYIPMDGPRSGAEDEAQFFTEPGVTSLYSATSTDPINVPLYLNATATDYYLYVAIKDMTTASNPYKIAKQYSTTPFNGSTNLNMAFPITIADICAQTANCDFSASLSSPKIAMAYFYLSPTSGQTIGAPITPATDGVYFEINMSNRVYPLSSIQPSISDVRAGDKRLTIKYTSNANIAQPKAIRIYNYGSPATSPGDNLPIQSSFSAGGGLLPQEYTYSYTGEVVVTDLQNEVEYNLAIVFVDLYRFGTVVSNYKSGKAMTIEELLKKNQCFLLTAGFGEDHYVIDYFRHFRDHVLAHSFLGRAFIHTYYELAPKYALMIYTHEGIRATIRGAAYALYFIFNYALVLGLLLAGAVSFYLFRRRNIKVG